MQLNALEDKLIQPIAAAFAQRAFSRIGVAVSGGSDSCALLDLMAKWGAEAGVELLAATVDHGLRSEAKLEAEQVAQQCAALNIPHTTLHWQGWDGKGNTQDQARRARYGLMAKWGIERGLDAISLGHTMDDQAETFLMRLGRGAGVDGLSGMAANHRAYEMEWIRPMLKLRREELRSYLKQRGICWSEDPSNDDTRFERVKMRQALSVLDDLGLSADKIAATTNRLRDARRMLESQTQIIARDICTVEHGDVIFNGQGLQKLDVEYRLRLLNHALCWVSTADYGPRRKPLSEVEQAIGQGKSATLHGCRILTGKSEVRICREYQAVKDLVCATNMIWDNRWKFEGPHDESMHLGALGQGGLDQCDASVADLPKASLISSPAVWQNKTLIAAPLATMGNGWLTSMLFGQEDFISCIKSH